jgi:GNAT superfamily N-acetyltransferase
MSIKLTYSEMTMDDVEEVFSIQNSSYENSIGEPVSLTFLKCVVCGCPDFALIARDENGTIVGGMIGATTKGKPCMENLYTLNHPEADHVVTHSLFVKPEFKGKGIGQQIAEYYFKEWIPNHIIIENYRSNLKYCFIHSIDRHYKWNESLGFRAIGLSEDIKLPNGEPYIEFIMDIK